MKSCKCSTRSMGEIGRPCEERLDPVPRRPLFMPICRTYTYFLSAMITCRKCDHSTDNPLSNTPSPMHAHFIRRSLFRNARIPERNLSYLYPRQSDCGRSRATFVCALGAASRLPRPRLALLCHYHHIYIRDSGFKILCSLELKIVLLLPLYFRIVFWLERFLVY